MEVQLGEEKNKNLKLLNHMNMLVSSMAMLNSQQRKSIIRRIKIKWFFWIMNLRKPQLELGHLVKYLKDAIRQLTNMLLLRL
jgi:hypothetical protein